MATTDDQAPPAAREAPVLDARLHAAWEAIRRPDIKVVSTDIFDTLMWRQMAEPADAFALVGERLRRRRRIAAHLSPGAFRNLRKHAEHQARVDRAHAFNDLEVTLEEIYARLPHWLFNFQEIGRPVAVDTELAVERAILVPDLDVVALLSAAGALGKAVVAVSDTYFSEPQLRALLDQPGLEGLEIDRIFSSSEHRRSKVDGLLEVMVEEMGVAASNVVHLGDNHDADIKPAQRIGITPFAFERHPEDLAELIERERRFAEPPARAPDDALLFPEVTSLRGKVAARSEALGLPPALQPYWRNGALVLGPVFAGFGEWVQLRAAEHRLERLFCFMREGEFLVSLVDRAGAALGLPARGERLWLNRQTLAAAAIGDASIGDLAGLLVRRRTPTVNEFLETVGLGLSDVPGFFSHAETRLDDAVVRENLFATLSEDEGLRARIVEYARGQRERVVAYVEQLLGGDDVMGVVDLGWGASAQRLLRHVLVSAGREVNVLGFYLLTHDGVAASGTNARGFLGEFGEPADASKAITRTPEILEQLCMPDHGPQVGLDEQLEPIIASAAHDRLQMVEAAALRHGVESFQREWSRYRVAMPGKLASFEHGAHVLRPLLMRQLQAPTELEATLLGGWAHDENQGSDRAEEIADLRHSKRLRHLAPDQLRELPMNELYWPAGLAARADPSSAELFAAAASGVISWESLSSEVESGPFTIEAVGTDIDPKSAIGGAVQRNRLGLSEVAGSITAPAIAELVIRPSSGPSVLRLDYLEVACHVQGSETIETVSLQAPADFGRLVRSYLYLLNPNVFVAHSHSPALHLDLRPVTPRTIFRVDVRCGFALLPISALLPTPGRLQSVEEAGVRVEELEKQIADIVNSRSWRLIQRLRRLAGRG